MDLVERLIVYRDRQGRSFEGRELLAEACNEIVKLRKEKSKLIDIFAGLKTVIEEIITAGVLGLFVAFVASSVPARASPSCLTLGEARAAYPGKHLYWHGPRHCWDDRGLGHAAVSTPVRPALPPAQINDAPAATILYPTLVMDMDPPDPALLAPAPATDGPLLLDVDEITGAAIDANSNKATPRVESSFRDRWLAMPASWFLAAVAERIK